MKIFIGLLMLTLTGCEPLVVRPGADFQLELLNPTPVKLRQAVAPVELQFRLRGCEVFALEAVRDSDARDLQLTPRDDGTFVTTVPLNFMTAGACYATDSSPLVSRFSLVATCQRDRRKTAVRVEYEIVSTAWQWRTSAEPFSDSTILHPLPDGRLLVLSGGQLMLGQFDGEESSTDTTTAFVPAGSTDRLLVSNGERCYFSFHCPIEDCGFEGQLNVNVEGAGQQTVFTEPLFEFSVVGNRIHFSRVIQVSPHTDMAFDADGDLVLLGGFDRSRTIPFPVNIVRLSAQQAPRFQWFGPSIPVSNFTRLEDGRLAFLNSSFGMSPDSLSLVTPRGDALQSYSSDNDKFDQTYEIPGGPVTRVDPLRPRWLTLTKTGAWVGRYPRQWHPILVDPALEQTHLKATWLSDAVVLWDSNVVQLIPLEESNRTPIRLAASVKGVAGDEKFLITTSTTAIHVFGREGQLVAGVDPLPCGWTPTSPPLLQGNRLLVATSGGLLGLDLSSY